MQEELKMIFYVVKKSVKKFRRLRRALFFALKGLRTPFWRAVCNQFVILSCIKVLNHELYFVCVDINMNVKENQETQLEYTFL